MGKPSKIENFTLLDFTNPNTKEVAYILGFLWADGHVSKSEDVSLEIVSSDADDVIDTFDKTGNWRKYFRQRKHWKPMTALKTGNRAFANILTNFDYREKSLVSPEKILTVIPDELKHYWFRGYFDGDGCFSLGKKYSSYMCIAAGSYEQDWTFLINLCNKLKIDFKIKRIQAKSSKNSTLTISGINSVAIFGKFIYQGDDTIGLKRKYNKYKEMLEVSTKYKYLSNLMSYKYKSINILTGEQKIYNCYTDIVEANFIMKYVNRCISPNDKTKSYKGFHWERLN